MIIGITGGIGSGKSVIAKQLRRMGYAVYDTDSEAKKLILEDKEVRRQIEQLFGSEVYAHGVYQTAWVAQQVFADKSLLAKLNTIVHPAVKADILRWNTSLRNTSPNNLMFVECAILYQAGLDTLCDKVVAITASEDIRIQRVIARDHSTIDQVRARMRAQNAEQFLQRADIVINNDGYIPVTELCSRIQQALTTNP